MRSAKYIGRVGALAFALGVGAGLTATGPWASAAESPDSGSSSVSSPSSPAGQSDSDSTPRDPAPSKNDDADDSAQPSESGDESAPDDSDGAPANVEDADVDVDQADPPAGAAQDSESDDDAPPAVSDTDAEEEPADDSEDTELPSESAHPSVEPVVARIEKSETPEPTAVVTDIASSEETVAPSVNDAPATPVDPPEVLALAAFSRREAEQAVEQIPASQSTSLALADGPSWDPNLFTGEPTFVSQMFGAVFGLIGAVGDFFGIDLSIPITKLLSSESPPWFITLGLEVKRDEFEGMPVWTLRSPDSTSQEAVIGLHGGALLMHPIVLNWLDYATIAANTGAAVVVPIYPLAGEGGTARTVIPAIADLIADQISQRGAVNVSVLGDSAGGNIALAAVQELVRRHDTVPSRMVLSSPGLDSTLSNPDIRFVNDPVLGASTLPILLATSAIWADGLPLTDPMVSPLYGSLDGLPPTTVYSGSRDIVMPDVLLLREKAAATPGADFTFVLRNGEFHDWAIVTLLPETAELLPDMYRQLGIGAEVVTTLGTCDVVGVPAGACEIAATS